MDDFTPPHEKQSGAMLLEALIAILIFSLGILAIIGLQSNAINFASDAKYRVDASLLANDLVSDMWANRLVGANALITNFSNGGAGYNAWYNSTSGVLPGAKNFPPAVSGVAITSAANPLNVSTQFTITVFWQPPGAASGVTPHQYMAITQIAP